MIRTRTMLPVIATLAAAGAASATIDVGSRYTTNASGQVFAQFSSSSSPFSSGQLYFLSYRPSGGSPVSVTSNTYYNLGKYLFDSRSFDAGYTVYLGTFDAGTMLNFAYRVTPLSGGATSVIRTDTVPDAPYFGLVAANPLTGASPQMVFEDQKSTTADFDFNDMVFNIVTVPGAVPAPGAVSLAFLGVLALAARARRG